jgi:hypothetical protein
VLILTQQKRSIYSIYAKRRSKVTVHGIANGTYRAFVVDGLDWDRKLRAFSRDCGFWRFEDSTKLGVPPRYYDYWQYWFNRTDRKVTTEPLDPEAAIRP